MKLSLICVIWLCVFVEDASLFRRFDVNAGFANKACDNNKSAFKPFYTTSLVRCASWCKLIPVCASFFYSLATSTCVGCNETYTFTGELTEEMEGSLYYSTEVSVTRVVGEKEFAAIWLGCYSQYCGELNEKVRCPFYSSSSSAAMTIDMCLRICGSFSTFAVKMIHCYCSYEQVENMTNCTTKCPGDSSQICGGDGIVSVFNITSF